MPPRVPCTTLSEGQVAKRAGLTAYCELVRVERDNAGQARVLPLPETPPKSMVSGYKLDVDYRPVLVKRVERYAELWQRYAPGGP
jgi:hypothetical protein